MALKVIQFDPPLPDALVAFVDPNTRRVVTGGLTDSQGRLSIYIREGTYELYVSKSGYNPYHKTVQITKDTVISVNLADPDVVDPIYLYDKSGNVINPATEDTLSSILSHAQWIGGFRLRHFRAIISNYEIAAGETYTWLDVSGVGGFLRDYAWKAGDGVDLKSVRWYIYLDDYYFPPLRADPLELDYWGLSGAGVHNLGCASIIVRNYDTSTGLFEAQTYWGLLLTIFRNSLKAEVVNNASSSTKVHHIIYYKLFAASTTIEALADEAVNASDLKRYINFMHGKDLCESTVYRLVNITKEGIEAAKLVVEGRAPPEPYSMLDSQEAELWLRLGEGKHHLVELTVDEKKFANLKEFWEFINFLEKEFNMKLLDVSLDVLNIPDYIP